MNAGFSNYRLFRFFGALLTSWQAAPAIYAVMTASLLLAGKRRYCRLQVIS